MVGSCESVRVYFVFLSLTERMITGKTSAMIRVSMELGAMVSGISEAASIAVSGEKETSIASYWRAYQAGILMLMVAMLIGAFFVVERTPSDQGGKAS